MDKERRRDILEMDLVLKDSANSSLDAVVEDV